mmetsp:Transcript_11009/g.19953  ORF Transcript_11009/g.19953 Transcript_11009/m.19953 type:complete len:361 (-) Transcript_11009:96-1178(-)
MASTPTSGLQEVELIKAAYRVRDAASTAEEAVSKAMKTSTPPSKNIYDLTAKTAEEAAELLQIVEAWASRRKERQTLAEFTTMLGEEVQEAAMESAREGVKYAERRLLQARSLIEDHFNIDEAFVMLGPLRHNANLARDVHDWFNLVALLPVIAFNVANWSCYTGTLSICGLTGGVNLPDLWHGEAYQTFWWVTCSYFIADLAFVIFLPQCVKSPGVIIKHHVATLAYICVPKLRPQYGWLMGACMIVEVNTWFLIARRSFNKNGDKMFQIGVSLAKSLRLLLVSSCFYVSWFVIRLGFYPYLLVVIWREWSLYSISVGSPLNILTVTPVIQCILIFMNAKWTIDLIRSKLKGRGPGKGL